MAIEKKKGMSKKLSYGHSIMFYNWKSMNAQKLL